MVRCLELYYRQAKSQKDIARALGVSAATVSRLLKRAYDDGFVRVELDLPRMAELEAALVERHGLRDAVVVATGGRGLIKEELGRANARTPQITPAGSILWRSPTPRRAASARGRVNS